MRVPILLHGREHSGLATEAAFDVVLFPCLEMRLVFGFAVGLTPGFTFGFAVVRVCFG